MDKDCQQIRLPEEFERNQIADERLFQSYESLSHQEKVWIKTTLALTEAIYEPFLGEFTLSLNHETSGLQITKALKAAVWSILLLDKGYASAPRLASAIMTARLANVQNIIAVWLEDAAESNPTEISSNVLTALELTGVETLLILKKKDLDRLIGYLDSIGQGRILYFPDQASALKEALPMTTPRWKEIASPRLFIDPESPIDKKALAWAHPNAFITSEQTLSALQNLDALYCSPQREHIYRTRSIPRIFNPGLEAFWFHPRLSPEFFIEKAWKVSFLDNAVDAP